MNIEEVILNSQLQDSVKNILESGESSENNPVVLNDGSRFLQLYGSVLTDENENKTGAVLVLNDVTRTCQLERVRRDFVANVSHELKTPVTSIQGFVETLLEGAAKDTEQTKRFLNIIARHTDRLNAIIEDLLSLSRLEEDSETRRLSFEKVKLKPALESAVELSKVKASQKNIEIKLSCDKNISVKINSPLIEQAVLNLISNAVKYSEKASTVEIKVTQKNEQVLISVSDHGCGIGKKHLERIFERFYVIDKSRSRKLGGTGLGLAIVKHICQVHGGYITAESEIDKGSTFTIFLPGK
jgi:two-component system phosphate regulon sensor histidine kinase PhoR